MVNYDIERSAIDMDDAIELLYTTAIVTITHVKTRQKKSHTKVIQRA